MDRKEYRDEENPMAVANPKHDRALIEEARRLRARNLSLHMIAILTGIPRGTLGDYLRGEGETFYEIRCEHCGEDIVAFSAKRRYCNHRCGDAFRRQMRQAS